MRAASIGAFVALCSLGCGSGPVEEPTPRTQLADAPSLAFEEVTWPEFPSVMRPGVRECVDDYRELAVAGLPPQRAGQEFREWYAGPFDGWVQSYNATRERCDAITSELDDDGPEAQVLLGVSSYLHERMGQESAPYEAEPQMHVMSRYWTLGASCTYDLCAEGPDEAWASFCRSRDRMMPPCPPVEADPSSVSSPGPDDSSHAEEPTPGGGASEDGSSEDEE